MAGITKALIRQQGPRWLLAAIVACQLVAIAGCGKSNSAAKQEQTPSQRPARRATVRERPTIDQALDQAEKSLRSAPTNELIPPDEFERMKAAGLRRIAQARSNTFSRQAETLSRSASATIVQKENDGTLATLEQRKRSGENLEREIRARLQRERPEIEKALADKNVFGAPSLTPRAWFEREWGHWNGVFERGEGFSSAVRRKTRSGPFEVVPLRVEQDPDSMGLAVLNLKGLLLERELRLRRVMATSAEPQVADWRAEMRRLQSLAHGTSERKAESPQVSRPPKNSLSQEEAVANARRRFDGIRQDAEIAKAARDNLRNSESVVRKLALGLPGAGLPRVVTVKEIQNALPDGTALVEYLAYGRDLGGTNQVQGVYGALVVTRDRPAKWLVLGSVSEIDSLIAKYNGYVRRTKDTAPRDDEMKSVLHELYDKIWRPVQLVMGLSVESVMVCPDKQLHFLSFGTLWHSGRFVGQDWSVRIVTSGRDLLQTKLDNFANRSVEVWAAPDYAGSSAESKEQAGGAHPGQQGPDGGQRPSFPPLEGTRSESEALRKLCNELGGYDVTVRTGREATEGSLARVHSPLVLVLATHGFALPSPRLDKSDLQDALNGGISPEREIDYPMHRSGLALAGADKAFASWGPRSMSALEDDGILTAAEAGNLDLQQTWLVALSACDTGAGGVADGETALCLKLGFIQAGARNLMYTLWPLDDSYASEFSGKFFREALKTRLAPESLAKVQATELVRLSGEPGPNPVWRAVRMAGPYAVNTRTAGSMR